MQERLGEPLGLRQLLHDKSRGLEGLDNLMTRSSEFRNHTAPGATVSRSPGAPGLDGEAETGGGYPGPTEVPMSPNRKWIYSTLCRASYFEQGTYYLF